MFKVSAVNKHYGIVNKHDPLITDLFVTDDTDTDIDKLEKCQTIKNPAVDFTNRARNSEFDDLTDKEFQALLKQ